MADAFIEAGAAGLKSRPGDDRDVQIAQLRAKLGEVTMDAELLQEVARVWRIFLACTNRTPTICWSRHCRSQSGAAMMFMGAGNELYQAAGSELRRAKYRAEDVVFDVCG